MFIWFISGKVISREIYIFFYQHNIKISTFRDPVRTLEAQGITVYYYNRGYYKFSVYHCRNGYTCELGGWFDSVISHSLHLYKGWHGAHIIITQTSTLIGSTPHVINRSGPLSAMDTIV